MDLTSRFWESILMRRSDRCDLMATGKPISVTSLDCGSWLKQLDVTELHRFGQRRPNQEPGLL